MSLLTLSGVSFEFSSGTPVFQNVSLSINSGDRIALVGPNGAGKTTFLHLLAAALPPSKGVITRRRGLQIAVYKQDSRIVGQSGGEHSREQLSRLLATNADLVVLDEPTNHLEIEAQEALEGALRSYPGTVIAVSHDRAFLEALGENAKLMEFPSPSANSIRPGRTC